MYKCINTPTLRIADDFKIHLHFTSRCIYRSVSVLVPSGPLDNIELPVEVIKRSLAVYNDISESETRFACEAPSHKSQWLVRLCCCHGYRIKPLTKFQLENEFLVNDVIEIETK